jgi:hypothetical protein
MSGAYTVPERGFFARRGRVGTSRALGVISLADGAGLLPHLSWVAGAALCEPRLPFLLCPEYGSDGQCEMGQMTNGGTRFVRPYYS